jgi:hypothetical protein
LSDYDCAIGGAYNDGAADTRSELRDLITELLVEGIEVPQKIRDFCLYDDPYFKRCRGEIP